MRRTRSLVVVVLAAGALRVAADEAKPVETGVVVSASSEGFALQSESGDVKLQLKGLVQFDGRVFPGDGENLLMNNTVIRRARPIIQGTVAKYFDFNFTPDFGGVVAVIQDAFLEAKVSPRFAVRVGKFKPPIGIEHLQSDTNLAFVERALPAGLEPNRDIGVEIHGILAKGVLSYAAGIFDGTPDGASVDTDTNDGKALVGRIVLSPFKAGHSALKGLSLGVAGSTETQSGSLATLASYKTGGQNSFFSYGQGVAPAGTRTRISPEIAFYAGPFGVLAEYAKSTAEVQKTATTGPVALANTAWQTTASVVLTGDTAGFDGVKVDRPFDPVKGQWGALQLATRVNGFEADAASFTQGFADIAKSARRAFAWAVGLNWYPNRNLKQAVTFERTTFTGGAAQGGDRPAENALLIRSQLSF